MTSGSDSLSVSVGVYNLDVSNFFSGFSFVGEFSYKSQRVTTMGIGTSQGKSKRIDNATNERGVTKKKGSISRKAWRENPSLFQR